MTHPAFERTVVLIKPDAIQRGYTGEIIHRFERKGLQMAAIKMMVIDDKLIRKHYAHHVDKDWFPGFKEFMQSTPIIAMIWEGPQAISVVRNLVGTTKGHEAPAGTIRGDFTIEPARNAVHASDSLETALDEIGHFFDPDEIFDYLKTSMQHVFEDGRT